MADNVKIPLPRFLKILTGQNVPVPKAMAISGKIYKEYNTPAKLAELDDGKLLATGLDNKEDRKLVLKVLRESGHLARDSRKKRSELSQADSPTPGSSSATLLDIPSSEPSPSKKKRKRSDSTVNEFLPSVPADEEIVEGNLEFREILDEEVLKFKSTVVNRAPIMMAWSTVVAESMGFRREEALSIASVYTEMNAKSKGVSIGIYKEGSQLGLEAVEGGTQSYVELMGRRPLYQAQNQQWRALANGKPVESTVAYAYISRSLRQTMPHIMGALRLLAESYPRGELNKVAWSLYADFRPFVDQWGKRSEVKCSTILNLRKKKDINEQVTLQVQTSNTDPDEPSGKKLKLETPTTEHTPGNEKTDEEENSPNSDSD